MHDMREKLKMWRVIAAFVEFYFYGGSGALKAYFTKRVGSLHNLAKKCDVTHR